MRKLMVKEMRRAKQLCEQFSRRRGAFSLSSHSGKGVVAIRGVQPVGS